MCSDEEKTVPDFVPSMSEERAVALLFATPDNERFSVERQFLTCDDPDPVLDGIWAFGSALEECGPVRMILADGVHYQDFGDDGLGPLLEIPPRGVRVAAGPLQWSLPEAGAAKEE
jgi:hypothetical protein